MCLAKFLILFSLLHFYVSAENECGKSPNALERYASQIRSNLRAKRTLNPTESKGHDWPWMAHFYQCSSSIIGSKWILTAAHCKDLPVAAIRYGNDDRTYAKFGEIKDKFPHPDYEAGKPGHDIMLIELQEPLTFNANVSQICLPSTPFSSIPDTKVVIAGWGKIFQGFQYWINVEHSQQLTNNDAIYEATPILHDQLISIRERGYCANLTSDMLCAGGIGEGSTPEDSGGALMTILNGRFYQQGIIAGGDMFSVAGRNDTYEEHGYYTDVSQYCAWIKETSRGEVECQK